METDSTHAEGARTDADPVDAVMVGAGFSGLYTLHRLRDDLGLDIRVFEKADGVGGTWYWNRYPGARCDSESHIYCYSFSAGLYEEWEWTERYPEQPEILEYLNFAADRLDLREDIEFGREVGGATWDDDAGLWTVELCDGETVRTRFFLSAMGCLSKPMKPDFAGLDDYAGETFHTARWPAGGVELAGKTVGVIGTGSTGIQFISEIAGTPEHFTVFQRTPNYAVPARNRPLSDEEYAEIRENYEAIWERARDSRLGMPFEVDHLHSRKLSDEEIREVLEGRWQQGGFRFLHAFEPQHILTDRDINETVSAFIRDKIRERVDDPETAEKLVPTDHPYGSKRPPMDYGDYYGTYNREGVSLVDVSDGGEPIERFTERGIRTAAAEYDLDVVVFATGFDAMTGAILALDIEGRGGLTLAEKWEHGPKTYLGLSVHGFPNFFTITGPQSPSVLTNMPMSIEQHADWITDCLAYMGEHGYDRIEAKESNEEQWVQNTNMLASNMLFSEAKSWYRGANVPGKPEIFTPFPAGLDMYRDICDRVAREDYDGFELGRAAEAETAD
jgi:cation diffusion facilitator CzcD-associated flavoprotein CzcO